MPSETPAAIASSQLMSRANTALVVVDIQEKLMPLIHGSKRVLLQSGLLIDAAKILGVPTLVTEQYPKGLGPTVPELAEKLPTAIDKLVFSCCGESRFVEALGRTGVEQVLLCGIEAHVCIQQTALELLANGYRVLVAADAVGSRTAMDRHWGLSRLMQSGVTVTTAESAVFEWTRQSGTPEFKQVSDRIKEHARLLEQAGLRDMREE